LPIPTPQIFTHLPFKELANLPIRNSEKIFLSLFSETVKRVRKDMDILSELANLPIPNSELLARRVRSVTQKFAWPDPKTSPCIRKSALISAREPSTSTKEHLYPHKRPHIRKSGLTSAKEPCNSAKEPCMSAPFCSSGLDEVAAVITLSLSLSMSLCLSVSL